MSSEPRAERTPSPLREIAAVLLVLVAASGIRLISMPYEAAWYDEIATLEFVDSPTLGEFLRHAHSVTPVPPVYSITQYGWARLFGGSVLSVRLLSFVYGIAGIAALYALGRQLFGHRAGLLAAAWMSFNFWHIYHSQEIRFYSLMPLLALFAMGSFIRFYTRPGAATLSVHVFLSALMAWTHPLTVLLFAAQGLFLIAFGWKRPRLIVAWIIPHLLVAASIGLFLMLINRDVAYSQTGWLPRPHLWRGYPSVRGFLAMGSGLMEMAPTNAFGEAALPWRRSMWILVESITIGGFAVGAAQLYRGRVDAAKSAPLTSRELAVLLALWFVVPPLLAYVGSHVWRPIFLGRYLVFSYLPLYLVLGWCCARVRPTLGLALFLPLLAFDGLFYFPGPMRTPFDRITSTMETVQADTTRVYLDDMIMLHPVEYYWQGSPPEILGPFEMEQAVDPRSGVVQFEAKANWLLMTTEKRAHYMRLDLRRADAPFEEYYFRSLTPVWLFYVPGPFRTQS